MADGGARGRCRALRAPCGASLWHPGVYGRAPCTASAGLWWPVVCGAPCGGSERYVRSAVPLAR
eukprot:5018834-Prymnesium_polylepis.1